MAGVVIFFLFGVFIALYPWAPSVPATSDSHFRTSAGEYARPAQPHSIRHIPVSRTERLARSGERCSVPGGLVPGFQSPGLSVQTNCLSGSTYRSPRLP